MNCSPSTSDLAQWASIGFPVRFDVSTVTPYIVDRSAGRNKNVHDMVTACLQLNRIPYCKRQIADCGSQYSLNLTNTEITGGIAQANQAVGVMTGTGPGLVTAPLLGIIAGIFTHHSQAVQKEQDVLCSVTTDYNQFADQIEQMLKIGQIALQDAITTLQKAYYQLVAQLATIEGPGTSGCNAGCFFHSALDALLAFNKKYVYPSLVPAAKAVATPGTSSTQPVAGSTVGQPATSAGLLVGAIGYGLAGVH